VFDNINLIIEKIVLLLLVLSISYISFIISKRYIIKVVHKLIQKSKTNIDDFLIKNRVLEQSSYFVPLIILAYGFELFDSSISGPLNKIVLFLIAINVVFVLAKLLDTFLDVYNNYEVAKAKPIKSYIQLIKLAIYIIGAIIAVCMLIGVSPLAILSGLGALTAVLMIVFKDTILSLVATIQIFVNDLVREGDWIEVSTYGADGDVLDISLHTIKIQNFDKTIVSIPTYKLFDSAFKNYRGMSESGGRRIKRAINIDISSINVCNKKLLDKLAQIDILSEYISNLDKGDKYILNTDVVNNLTIFREYLNRYLANHPKIDNTKFTFLIRELAPTPKGLPIELYIFTNDNRWIEYESIQSKIFDHILIAIKEFELRVYQDISDKSSV
jgi:miniconductance mechanosensitive channel